jgi:polyether ionophore transport system permease protein
MNGVGALIRLVLRRDRWLLPLWIIPLGVIPVSYVQSFAALYPTPTDLQRYADVSAGNAAFVALYGKVYGSGLGEMTVWRAGFIPLMVGLFSLLTVIRHTRTEEEAGRRELIGSTPVGRHAGLAAALITVFAADLVVGLLLALSMSSQDLPMSGSLAFGAQFAMAGWIFAGVGAVAAQLTSGAGSARGIGTSVLGTAYLLRIAGDTTAASWLSWLSPIGWGQRIEPYATDRWWPVALALVVTAALTAGAVSLSARRDIDAGLLPARVGPSYAAPSLRSPLALAWRLHRGLLAAWMALFVALGLVFGGVADGVDELISDSEQMKEIFARIGGAGALVDAFFASILATLGIIAAGYAIQATLRLRSEETTGHAEAVLATPVSRLRWLASHAVFGFLGSALALLTGALATGVIYGVVTGDFGPLPKVLEGALVQLPAVWVLAALAVALAGALPRVAGAAWGGLAACLLILLVGGAIQLNQWVLDISPFTHLPHVPGSPVTALPLVVLLVIAAALAALGAFGLRRRDIPTG